MRYADDFVVLARQWTPALTTFLETQIEDRLGLTLNREKTRLLELRRTGVSLHFLGYRLGLERDLYGRTRRYLSLSVSEKALLRERAVLREMIGSKQCWKPLPQLVAELNRHLQGWASYYAQGRPRAAFRKLNSWVLRRVGRPLRRRSQRPWRCPEGVSLSDYLYHHLGLRKL